MVLVFGQAGLYRQRESRPGAGRIFARLIVVRAHRARVRDRYRLLLHDLGSDPTSVFVSAMTIGLFRAAYDSASLELMRAAGIRRRVVLVGEAESPSRLRQSLSAARGGLTTSSSGQSTRTSAGHPPPRLAGRASARARAGPPRRGDPRRGRLPRTRRSSRSSSRRTDQGTRAPAPDITEPPVQRGEYVPGQELPLLPASAAGADRSGLGGQEGDSTCVSSLSPAPIVGGCCLARRPAGPLKLTREAPIFLRPTAATAPGGSASPRHVTSRTMRGGAASLQAHSSQPANEAEAPLFRPGESYPRVTSVGRPPPSAPPR